MTIKDVGLAQRCGFTKFLLYPSWLDLISSVTRQCFLFLFFIFLFLSIFGFLFRFARLYAPIPASGCIMRYDGLFLVHSCHYVLSLFCIHFFLLFGYLSCPFPLGFSSVNDLIIYITFTFSDGKPNTARPTSMYDYKMPASRFFSLLLLPPFFWL